MRKATVLVMALVLGLPRLGVAVGQDDLKRYGFSRGFAGDVEETRKLDIPAPVLPASVPSPIVPGDLLDPRQVPGAPEYVSRVIRQRREAPTPGVEGPVADYPGEEHARAEEGTFKEVEDFFFRPSTLHRRLFSMNETGVTGLFNMATAELPRPGATFVRLGLGYTWFDRSSGVTLPDGDAIEQFLIPFTYQSVPNRNLELSLQVMGVSEENRGFPLVPAYELAGIRDVAFNAKYRFLDNPQDQVQAAFGFGLRVGVERDPTRLGSSGVDYSVFLAATKRIHNFGLHLSGGLTFPNGEDHTNSGVPEIGQLGLGMDFSPSDRLSVITEIDYTDWRFVGTNAEAVLGFKYKMTEQFTFDFGVPVQLSNDLAEGYRYRVLASVQAQL